MLLKHFKRLTGFTGPAIKQVGSPHLASIDSISKWQDSNKIESFPSSLPLNHFLLAQVFLQDVHHCSNIKDFWDLYTENLYIEVLASVNTQLYTMKKRYGLIFPYMGKLPARSNKTELQGFEVFLLYPLVFGLWSSVSPTFAAKSAWPLPLQQQLVQRCLLGIAGVSEITM